MKVITANWQFLLAGLYTWVVSTFFGVVLLDIVYANLALRTFTPSQTETVFSDVSDFLLIIGGLTILAGLGAILSSWNSAAARYLFVASMVLLLAEFLAPMLFFPLFESIRVNLGINIGPLFRLVGNALASLLAITGLWVLYASKS